MDFKISIYGQDHINRKLGLMIKAADDLRPCWKEAAKELEAIEQDAFETEGGTTRAGKWAALKNPRSAHKILQDTRRLVESLTKDNSDTIKKLKKKYMEWGTKVPYGIYHQLGTYKMPSRKFFSFTDKQKRDIVKVVALTFHKLYDIGTRRLLP